MVDVSKREVWHEFVYDNSSYGEARADYSGRGMNGKSVLAVTFEDDADLALFYQELGAFLDENGHEFIRCLRTDSLGRGTVLYPVSRDYHEDATAA